MFNKLALAHIEDHPHSRFIIFSDSKSALESLKSPGPRNPLVLDIINYIHTLSTINEIIFCWLPSHIGIKGNEVADREAKEALALDVSDVAIISSDFKAPILKLLLARWQQHWEALDRNKLREIKPSITDHYNISSSPAEGMR